MSSGLLREYIDELIATLHDAGFGGAPRERALIEAESLADGWLDDIELTNGQPVAPGIRTQVVRFVENRMPGLLVRFRGNESAAHMTMYNLLDAKFGSMLR